MDNLTKEQQLQYLIKESPGISTKELGEFFPGTSRNGFSAMLSVCYSKGNFRREKIRNAQGLRIGYRYWYEPGAKPISERAPKPNPKPSQFAVAVVSEDLKAQVRELEEWKTLALARFPDLAVEPAMLQARKIFAEQYKSDPHVVRDIMGGAKDTSPAIRAIVAALGMAG